MRSLIISLAVLHGLSKATYISQAPPTDIATWAALALNQSVGGRLYSSTPLSFPCFSRFNNETVIPDPLACGLVQESYTKPDFRESSYSGYMYPQWEMCLSKNQGCLLNSSDPWDPLAFEDQECYQGSVSPFYIEVTSASDVQAALNFSKTTEVPLVIKNSGHDFAGRSSMQGSLALWTRHLDSISYEPGFVPEGCSAESSYNVLTMGAGVNFEEAYAFADTQNVTLIGGYATTIGTSGGWLLGGGHSILSPVYGLGVDRVVQIKLVTPDGEFRVANECQNPDLFWALRGGGGGTFGVVLETTQKVEPQLTLQVASMSFNATPTNLQPWYELATNYSLAWALGGWGGHLRGASLIHVTPLLSLDEAKLSMKSASDYVISQGGVVVIETLPSWYAFFQKYVTSVQVGVGVELVMGTRLLPVANFQRAEGRAALVDVLMDFSTFVTPYIFAVTPLLFNSTENATSVTPAWRDALWQISASQVMPYSDTIQERQAVFDFIHSKTQDMIALAPDSGSYLNEGDIYESDYQTSYWGPNYSRLLEIKQKYDPLGLLDCWRCVGWKGASDKKFSCFLPEPGADA